MWSVMMKKCIGLRKKFWRIGVLVFEKNGEVFINWVIRFVWVFLIVKVWFWYVWGEFSNVYMIKYVYMFDFWEKCIWVNERLGLILFVVKDKKIIDMWIFFSLFFDDFCIFKDVFWWVI